MRIFFEKQFAKKKKKISPAVPEGLLERGRRRTLKRFTWLETNGRKSYVFVH